MEKLHALMLYGHEHFRDSQMSASSSDPAEAVMGINLPLPSTCYPFSF